ncbi:RNA polymerase factor sigma-54 [Mangrovicoccus sp. HB161399]|uniref:RNA polymerase factor sigma-54 n=1 Tax=Mangrovicoccus sp. HB161399 TaxID=2720392 RepID=UPI001556CCDC|nr:RNA polymerase factor sigma-54 [Mangrovicoccus sp. HB161399]
MQLTQGLLQRQTQTMSAQMLASLSILGMSNQDLAEHLAKKAESNPAIQFRPPQIYASGGEDFDQVAALASDKPSLMAYVMSQIDMTFAPGADRQIALTFAEALEPTGWLGQTVEAVADRNHVPVARAERVLCELQGLEPVGVFARSLGECLKIQAQEADMLTWELEVLLDNLGLLADGKTAELADLCDCEPSDIPDIARALRRFDPKPGLAFSHDRTPIFPPDLTAKRGPNGWTVSLTRSTLPSITVVPDNLPAETRDREAKAFRRRALAEARALAGALERRGKTLLRAATVLVARQQAFLDSGRAHLVPLSLEDVATELELHPSTISRATSGRMIDTPSGALPLRAFLSRAVPTADGQNTASQDAALEFVRKVIAEEDPAAPLSDEAIVQRSDAAGLAIARRTVAKYRSMLGIGSSFQRRRKVAV